jgi:hypothetical protein
MYNPIIALYLNLGILSTEKTSNSRSGLQAKQVFTGFEIATRWLPHLKKGFFRNLPR